MAQLPEVIELGPEEEARRLVPKLVYVDAENRIERVGAEVEAVA